MTRIALTTALAASVLATVCGPGSAAVKTYYARITPRGEMVLVGVGVAVDRGDRVVPYGANRLIGASRIHFRSPDSTNVVAPTGAASPGAEQRVRLRSDGCPNSGLINAGYGILPTKLDGPIDVYAADRAS